MKRICVFCGSSPGSRPEYGQAADQLAEAMSRRSLGLVYGGGRLGMMGRIALKTLEQGGEVIGVIPRKLELKEIALLELADLRVVDTMHQRKALMAELSDGFIALPGGLGTLEEIFEMITWVQLGYQAKPCGLLNTLGYYDAMLEFLDHAVDQAFIKPEHRALLLVENDPQTLLAKMESFVVPHMDKVAWALQVNRKEGGQS